MYKIFKDIQGCVLIRLLGDNLICQSKKLKVDIYSLTTFKLEYSKNIVKGYVSYTGNNFFIINYDLLSSFSLIDSKTGFEVLKHHSGFAEGFDEKDNLLYSKTGDSNYEFLSYSDLKPIWKFQENIGTVRSFNVDYIYYCKVWENHTLFKISPQTGDQLWQKDLSELGTWSHPTLSRGEEKPYEFKRMLGSYGDKIYLTITGIGGIVALDKATGELTDKWMSNDDAEGYDPEKGIHYTPGDFLNFDDKNGTINHFKRYSFWQLELNTGEIEFHGFANYFKERRIEIHSSSRNERDKKYWVFHSRFNKPSSETDEMVRKGLPVMYMDNKLVLFNLETGKVEWEYKLPDPISTTKFIGFDKHDRIYFLGDDEVLRIFEKE